MSFFMDPSDLPEDHPVRQMIEAQQTQHQVGMADLSHIHQWLVELDRPVAEKVELLLQWCANAPHMAGGYLISLRTSNHMRFGLCLNCGKDHEGAPPSDELIGHTTGHSRVDHVQRTQGRHQGGAAGQLPLSSDTPGLAEFAQTLGRILGDADSFGTPGTLEYRFRKWLSWPRR